MTRNWEHRTEPSTVQAEIKEPAKHSLVSWSICSAECIRTLNLPFCHLCHASVSTKISIKTKLIGTPCHSLTCSWPRIKTPPGLIGCQGARFSPVPSFSPSWKASHIPSLVVHVMQIWCHFPSLMKRGSWATYKNQKNPCGNPNLAVQAQYVKRNSIYSVLKSKNFIEARVSPHPTL